MAEIETIASAEDSCPVTAYERLVRSVELASFIFCLGIGHGSARMSF